MALKIIKFGGSSIADSEKIRHVASIVRDKKSRDELAIPNQHQKAMQKENNSIIIPANYSSLKEFLNQT